MKLSYALATPETEDAKILAARGGLEENFKMLSDLGYPGIELMIRDPKKLDVGEIKDLCKEYNIEITSVSTGQLRKELGLQLCSIDAGVWSQTIDKTLEVIDFTAEFNTQMNIGTLRGTMPIETSESVRAKEQAVIALNKLLDYSQTKKMNIALEPQNRYTINWLNNAGETLEFINCFSQKNLKMVFDAYHWLLEEPSLYASLIKAYSYVSHVQFSDSNRLAPGWGQMNYPDIVRVLRALNYTGYITIECNQTPDTYQAAKQAIDYLLPFLNETE
ncbi:MAG: sugar phosphate isomerase/epimerase [Fibrobacteria bacterium]|nr:sugar phosphate isomerase/epimerase [Fibrobacteria bacterium]